LTTEPETLVLHQLRQHAIFSSATDLKKWAKIWSFLGIYVNKKSSNHKEYSIREIQSPIMILSVSHIIVTLTKLRVSHIIVTLRVFPVLLFPHFFQASFSFPCLAYFAMSSVSSFKVKFTPELVGLLTCMPPASEEKHKTQNSAKTKPIVQALEKKRKTCARISTGVKTPKTELKTQKTKPVVLLQAPEKKRKTCARMSTGPPLMKNPKTELKTQNTKSIVLVQAPEKKRKTCARMSTGPPLVKTPKTETKTQKTKPVSIVQAPEKKRKMSARMSTGPPLVKIPKTEPPIEEKDPLSDSDSGYSTEY
jgi:hypothetical protein